MLEIFSRHERKIKSSVVGCQIYENCILPRIDLLVCNQHDVYLLLDATSRDINECVNDINTGRFVV